MVNKGWTSTTNVFQISVCLAAVDADMPEAKLSDKLGEIVGSPVM